MEYRVYELANGRFGVYQMTESLMVLVKTFKTRKNAEGWISKR